MPLPGGFTLQLAQGVIDGERGADIDISGPEFNFVRSIRVYDIEWRQYIHYSETGEEHCRTPHSRVRLGSYGIQGEFSWRDTSVTSATTVPWLGFSTRDRGACDHEGSFRGVGVEWHDYDGNHRIRSRSILTVDNLWAVYAHPQHPVGLVKP